MISAAGKTMSSTNSPTTDQICGAFHFIVAQTKYLRLKITI